MPKPVILRALIAAGLVAGVASCKGVPTMGRLKTGAVAVAGQPAAAPTAAAADGAAATGPAPAPSAPAPRTGVLGAARLPGGPFAGAEVLAYLPGEATPVAKARTTANGTFGLDLEGRVPAGALLKIVAAGKGQALASVAAAGLIGADGASLIGADGASLVAAGAGNYRVPAPGFTLLAAPRAGEARLTVASTLAVAALGDRLNGALRSAKRKDGSVVADAVGPVMAAFGTFSDAAEKALGRDAAGKVVDDVLGLVGTDGEAEVPRKLALAITKLDGGLEDAFEAAAKDLGAAVNVAVQAGGTVPTDGLGRLTFGDAVAPAAEVDGAPRAGGGGSGGSGSRPAPVSLDVHVHGNFVLPSKRPI